MKFAIQDGGGKSLFTIGCGVFQRIKASILTTVRVDFQNLQNRMQHLEVLWILFCNV